MRKIHEMQEKKMKLKECTGADTADAESDHADSLVLLASSMGKVFNVVTYFAWSVFCPLLSTYSMKKRIRQELPKILIVLRVCTRTWYVTSRWNIISFVFCGVDIKFVCLSLPLVCSSGARFILGQDVRAFH